MRSDEGRQTMAKTVTRPSQPDSAIPGDDYETRAQRNAEAIRVLRSFLDGDEQEQRETWAYLRQALDEDRPSGQKIFP